jgi:NMD protein affecting ribosome stability and mRNA decay
LEAHEHHVTHHEIEAKTCRTCGHLMEPGMRICYECGSIQRGARAKGMHRTPSQTASCHLCGGQIPDYKTLCEKCAAVRKKQAAEAKSADMKVDAPEAGTSRFRALVEAIVRFLHRLFPPEDKAA